MLLLAMEIDIWTSRLVIALKQMHVTNIRFLFGMVKTWPFERLGDLQEVDKNINRSRLDPPGH